MTTASANPPPRVVILPVDNSTHCERAFSWYLRRAHRPYDKLILTHIVRPDSRGGVVTERFDDENFDSTNENVVAGKRLLEKYAAKCQKLNFNFEKTLRADSNVGAALIKVADEYYASLIVIASQGVNRVKRTILGSCSNYVIQHSGVPVLVVPPAKRSSASFSVEVQQAADK